MNLVNWSPARNLDDFYSDYRNLFGRAVAPTGMPEIANSEFDWRPVADIIESKNEYLVKVELPEVKREDVSITIDDGILKIEGERKFEKSADDEKQRRTESFHGSFFRAFSLPDNVNEEKIRAESKDGVLSVHLPKTAEKEREARTISIK